MRSRRASHSRNWRRAERRGSARRKNMSVENGRVRRRMRKNRWKITGSAAAGSIHRKKGFEKMNSVMARAVGLFEGRAPPRSLRTGPLRVSQALGFRCS